MGTYLENNGAIAGISDTGNLSGDGNFVNAAKRKGMLPEGVFHNQLMQSLALNMPSMVPANTNSSILTAENHNE